MSSTEARAARRIAAGNRVNILVQGRVILAAIAVNISMGGLYLSASAPLPVGSPCEVAIFLPEGSGSEKFLAQGSVVRTAADGMAIQFAKMLGDQTLEVIANPPSPSAWTSLAHAYVSYFKVSQSNIGYDCERVFGITRRTFRAISTTSFLTSIPAAILPVWLLRASIPAIPDWAKIIACFAYGAFWLLLLQPLFDLAVIKLVRSRAARTAQTKR